MTYRVDLHLLYTKEHLIEFAPLIEYNKNILRNEGLDLRLLECPDGDISRCRAKAAMTSSAPLFGWLDCDDILIRGAYTKLLHEIETTKKPFAWMNELLVTVDERQCEGLVETIRHPHHIHLIHKDLLDYNFLCNNPDKNRPDAWLKQKVNIGIHINEIGYIWRRRLGQSTSIISFQNHKNEIPNK